MTIPTKPLLIHESHVCFSSFQDVQFQIPWMWFTDFVFSPIDLVDVNSAIIIMDLDDHLTIESILF
eukprot:UN14762